MKPTRRGGPRRPTDNADHRTRPCRVWQGASDTEISVPAALLEAIRTSLNALARSDGAVPAWSEVLQRATAEDPACENARLPAHAIEHGRSWGARRRARKISGQRMMIPVGPGATGAGHELGWGTRQL